jgi:eukaryotic-like serine/threonine-protein kinase
LAAVAAVVLLFLVALAFWPRSGRSTDSPVAGPDAVWSQPAAPGADAAPSASVSASESATSAGRRSGPGGAIQAGTVTPQPANGVSHPPATGHATPTGTRTSTTEPTTAPPTTDPPVVRKLTSSGGSVQATCPQPATAQIQSADPVKPFKKLSVDTAAGTAPTAVFKHGKTRVTMTITCQGGEPSTANTTTS